MTTDNRKITVLITGRYNPDYNRNLILFEGLRNLGVELIEYPYRKKNRESSKKITAFDQEADFIFLPSFTHLDVRFVRRHTTKPLIFDPLISRYMSKVFDYRSVHQYSIRALKNYLKDYLSMNQADVVIADTYQHLLYFERKIKVDKQKMDVVPVGVSINKFYPMQLPARMEGTIFRIGFYGTFIPLHGIDKIIEAARLLENDTTMQFELIGKGFNRKEMEKLLPKKPLNNLRVLDSVPYDLLNGKINEFDLCLGIFGDGIKPASVVPNKIYHYAACEKCIITRDSEAIREVFTDQQDILLTDGTPEDLADKIIYLKNNREKRDELAVNARKLVQLEYNQDAVAGKLLNAYLSRFSRY